MDGNIALPLLSEAATGGKRKKAHEPGKALAVEPTNPDSKKPRPANKIKKLIDMEALSLSRLKLVVLDMQRDPNSFNLFTLPQVSTEFWDLYKGYLGQKVREGDTRICFYGVVLLFLRKMQIKSFHHLPSKCL